MLTAELRFPSEGGGLNIGLNFDPSKKIRQLILTWTQWLATLTVYQRPSVRIKVLVWTHLRGPCLAHPEKSGRKPDRR